MNIIITGCAGFIGSHLSEFLLKQGHSIYGIDNLNDYYSTRNKSDNLEILKKYKDFHFYNEDICETNLITLLINKLDLIIHLAAMAGVRYSFINPEIYVKTNIIGTLNLIKQIEAHPEIPFIYASSSSVYGNLGNDIIKNEGKIRGFRETDILPVPESPYAFTKKSMENLCELWSIKYGLKMVGLRFFTVFGVRGRPDMSPFIFMSRIMKGEKIEVFGDGSAYRDFTHIDNIVNGINCIINHIKNIDRNDNNSNHHEIFNIGTGNPIKVIDFIRLIEKVTDKKAVIEFKEPQQGDVDGTYADCSKLNNIGYFPVTENIEDGLRSLYDFITNMR